ncbi:hypothetical protein EYF80_027793 [Liparis tanakae]|uniref:Uncharacterized protein n=1 Tax=Liparis tanakae TaxID=230148 RepID=A0A4Z2H7U5_9TELE|nr:hypothetical protein EYF80_027793 [Liparis tanakae]
MSAPASEDGGVNVRASVAAYQAPVIGSYSLVVFPAPNRRFDAVNHGALQSILSSGATVPLPQRSGSTSLKASEWDRQKVSEVGSEIAGC